MKIIIAGAGAVGCHVAKMLSHEQHDIVLLDMDEDKLQDIGSQCDIMTEVGSATSFADLLSCGVGSADLFIAVTSFESVNMTACMLAKNLGAKKTRRELFSLKARDVALCFLSGAFLAFHFYSWFESLNHTSITSSTVLVNTEVLFAAFGYLFFFHKRLKGKEIAAIAVTFGGSVVIAMADSGGGGHALYGDLLALAAAFFTAVYTLIGVREREHMSTTVYTYVLYWGSFLTLLVLNLVTGTPLLGYGAIDWAMGFCLAVFCTLLGHSVFSWCLKYLAPTYVSTAKLAEPVFASAVAFVLFGEAPGLLQTLGAAIVLWGVCLYARADRSA